MKACAHCASLAWPDDEALSQQSACRSDRWVCLPLQGLPGYALHFPHNRHRRARSGQLVKIASMPPTWVRALVSVNAPQLKATLEQRSQAPPRWPGQRPQFDCPKTVQRSVSPLPTGFVLRLHGLALQPPLHRAISGLGGFARLRGFGVQIQCFIKPRPRIDPVGFLRAVFLGFEDENAAQRQAAAPRLQPALA